MTLAPPVLRDAVSLRCDVAQPWEAHADVLVVVLPCGGSDVPAWLAPHAAAVRALAQGARLMIHRPADAAFQAGVVEVETGRVRQRVRGQPQDARAHSSWVHRRASSRTGPPGSCSNSALSTTSAPPCSTSERRVK